MRLVEVVGCKKMPYMKWEVMVIAYLREREGGEVRDNVCKVEGMGGSN